MKPGYRAAIAPYTISQSAPPRLHPPVLFIVFLALAFLALPVATLACDVPASAFNRLHEGMTYNEVAAVMGCDGDHKVHMPDASPDMAHPLSTVTLDEYNWGGVEAGSGFVMADFYDGKLHDWNGIPPRH